MLENILDKDTILMASQMAHAHEHQALRKDVNELRTLVGHLQSNIMQVFRVLQTAGIVKIDGGPVTGPIVHPGRAALAFDAASKAIMAKRGGIVHP